MRPILFLLLPLLAAVTCRAGGHGSGPRGQANIQMLPADAGRSLRERFADPPAKARILRIIHSWPDAPQAQDVLIDTLLRQGFGGVVCNVSFQDYLQSEARWQAFNRAVERADAAGMAMWLYDEKGYPSGTAGGLTLRDHPEWQARGLLVADAESRGGPVSIKLPPGELRLAAAFPVHGGSIDLQGKVDLAHQVEGRVLTWEAPLGDWQAMVITEDVLFEGTHAAVSFGDHIPYVNLMMTQPTDRFIELTHRQYADRLGPKLGERFVATFTDEPSLMSMFMQPMPYRVLPWTPDLPAEFERRRGYALDPLIPALVSDAGAAGSRARYDFWHTVAELTAERFFGRLQAWCRQHGIPSGGHLLHEEQLAAHVPLYGDFFRCARRLDAPSIDCLTSIPADVPWFVARMMGSVADLEGRTLTMCETSDFVQYYRPPGDQRPVHTVTEEEIRGACNRLLLGGINTITSYYSFKDLADTQLQRLNGWVGRCSTVLTGGHQVSDIAVLYPVESLWPRFTPARHGATSSAEVMRIEQIFRGVSEDLFAAGRDFAYIDAQALADAEVESGALVHGSLRWRVVVLPAADTLPLAAWQKLARFHRQGGVIIAAGARPANSETEFPSPQVQALAAEIFGTDEGPIAVASSQGGAGIYLPAGTEALLPVALDAVLEHEVLMSDRRAPVRATHRRIDDKEIYFLINDSNEPWTGSARLSAAGPGEIWDPASGTITPLEDPQAIPLDLPPYGGVLLRFEAAEPTARQAINSGPLPGWSLQPLPDSEPEVGQGEFVQAELSPQQSPDGRHSWRAFGRLTRGQVDTFLFTTFRYPQGLDLAAAWGLALDTWTPEGQQAGTPLLLIVNDRQGATFFAQLDRPLNLPGHTRALIPLNRLRPAVWTPNPGDWLDLSAITAMSIGWGGYYGSEGETVEFSLTAPQAAYLVRTH